MGLLLIVLHALLGFLASAVAAITALAALFSEPGERLPQLGLVLVGAWAVMFGGAAAIPVLLAQGLRRVPAGRALAVFRSFAVAAAGSGLVILALHTAGVLRESRGMLFVTLAIPFALPWIAGALLHRVMRRRG